MKRKSKLRARIDASTVYLRPVVLRDAPLIRRWHNDPQLIRLGRVGEKKTTMKQERAEIRAVRKSDREAYHMIIKQSDDSAIGFLRFNFIDQMSSHAWLRLMIGEKKAWGKGYARDAMEIYLIWLFDVICIHRVTLECYATNERAIKFYQHLGFRREGVLREAVLIDDKYHDIFSFGMLRKDLRLMSRG